jgi:hypothetical protein
MKVTVAVLGAGHQPNNSARSGLDGGEPKSRDSRSDRGPSLSRRETRRRAYGCKVLPFFGKTLPYTAIDFHTCVFPSWS